MEELQVDRVQDARPSMLPCDGIKRRLACGVMHVLDTWTSFEGKPA